MTDILERATKALEGVTEGIWRLTRCGCGHPSCSYHGTSNGTFHTGNGYSAEDAKFIIWCHDEGVPELLEEVKRLREALRGSTTALEAMRDLAKETKALQGREHIDLGITVHRAIDKARALLPEVTP